MRGRECVCARIVSRQRPHALQQPRHMPRLLGGYGLHGAQPVVVGAGGKRQEQVREGFGGWRGWHESVLSGKAFGLGGALALA